MLAQRAFARFAWRLRTLGRERLMDLCAQCHAKDAKSPSEIPRVDLATPAMLKPRLKASLQIAAFQEFVDDFGNDGAQDAVERLVSLGINLFKLGIMAVRTLPEWRFFWISGAIGLH